MVNNLHREPVSVRLCPSEMYYGVVPAHSRSVIVRRGSDTDRGRERDDINRVVQREEPR